MPDDTVYSTSLPVEAGDVTTFSKPTSREEFEEVRREIERRSRAAPELPPVKIKPAQEAV